MPFVVSTAGVGTEELCFDSVVVEVGFPTVFSKGCIWKGFKAMSEESSAVVNTAAEMRNVNGLVRRLLVRGNVEGLDTFILR